VRTGLLCIVAYAADLSNSQFSLFTGLTGSDSITNWKSFFRNLCSQFVDDVEQEGIGGPGFTVEIDETLVRKRKNHTGRLTSDQLHEAWVFGGICRETRQAFVVRVANRSSETLLAAIQQKILPGTRIISDGWKAYSQLASHGYIHDIVNHSENFVDPEDSTINTQRVERMWRTLKEIIPRGASSETRWTYLFEFVFKQRHNWFSLKIDERIRLILCILKKVHFE
jgi:transposase-like protein